MNQSVFLGSRRPRPAARRGLARLQRGVSLIFALMALVVLTLGAVALLRSVDTGLLVLGNLGFKQDALAAASVGTEAAINWLQGESDSSLAEDQRAKGYYATAITALEATGPRADAAANTQATIVDWSYNDCANVSGLNGRSVNCLKPSAEIDAGGGNKVRYIITRLCASNGTAIGNDCMKAVDIQTGTNTSQRGSLGYGTSTRFYDTVTGTYYRIVTRTEGVRGTVSFTETMVHF